MAARGTDGITPTAGGLLHVAGVAGVGRAAADLRRQRDVAVRRAHVAGGVQRLRDAGGHGGATEVVRADEDEHLVLRALAARDRAGIAQAVAGARRRIA